MTPTMFLLLATHVAAAGLGLWFGSKIWSTRAAAALVPTPAERDAVDNAGMVAKMEARERAAALLEGRHDDATTGVSDDDLQRRIDALRERGRAGK